MQVIQVFFGTLTPQMIQLFIFLGGALLVFLSASAVGAMFSEKRGGDCDIDSLLKDVGFAYDEEQDIFYSRMDSWQRDFGFCRIYDEAGAPLNMIMDCEPVRFDYGSKKWLIELWKGQYAMSTGAEIGVYTAEPEKVHLANQFDGYFYNAASDEDMLYMKIALYKGEKRVFFREGLHWWLTGFLLGGFSEPDELRVVTRVVLKSEEMAAAFLRALAELGYRDDRCAVDGRAVEINFTAPYSPQPITRTKITDWLIQRKNQLFCATYRMLMRKCGLSPQKLANFFCHHRRIYGMVTRRMTSGKQIELHKKLSHQTEKDGG